MNYIITSSNVLFSNLGHEIFLTRKIIIVLLENNYINTNYIIVTKNNDRKFLYSGIFKTISYNEYLKIDAKEIVIDLNCYMNSAHFVKINTLKKLKVRGKTLNEVFTKDYMTPTHIKLSKNFDLHNIAINKKFIIIHLKLNNSETIKEIYKLINILITKYNKYIIIFCNEYKNLEIYNNYQDNHILFTNDLQLYCSYLNNPNCELLISEWSGGGQICQFLLNTHVIYYYDFYPDWYMDLKTILYESSINENTIRDHPNWWVSAEERQQQTLSSFTKAWDHLTYTNIKKKFIPKKYNNNLHNYIIQYIKENNILNL
jgi:hypothetical protein